MTTRQWGITVRRLSAADYSEDARRLERNEERRPGEGLMGLPAPSKEWHAKRHQSDAE